jgi:hypothetical protein
LLVARLSVGLLPLRREPGTPVGAVWPYHLSGAQRIRQGTFPYTNLTIMSAAPRARIRARCLPS